MNGNVTKCTAFGLADGKLNLRILNGTPPYKVELKVNYEGEMLPLSVWNSTPFYRVVENIPELIIPEGVAMEDAPYNCIIGDLPPGKYSLIIFDNRQPEPQMNVAFSPYVAVAPPFVTLNGSVNPLGIPTTVSFEIGETLNYDKVVQAGVSNATCPTPIIIKLSSGDYNPISFLKPNTLYNYRIKATNPGGTVYGENLTFTTPTILPIVITLPATNIQ